MRRKTTKQELRSNTIPAIVTVGPVAVLLLFLVVAPLLFVAVMSFCRTDEYYNVIYQFTTVNYYKLLSLDYMKIYGQSLLIAFITTLLCVLIGYPLYHCPHTKQKEEAALYAGDYSVLDKLTDQNLWLENIFRKQRVAEQAVNAITYRSGTG